MKHILSLLICLCLCAVTAHASPFSTSNGRKVLKTVLFPDDNYYVLALLNLPCMFCNSEEVPVPVASGSQEADYYAAGISGDGSRIVFSTRASNLVQGASPENTHLYMLSSDSPRIRWITRPLNSGTRLLSCDSGQAPEECYGADISCVAVNADGSRVAFLTNANNLVSGQSQVAGNSLLYLWNRDSEAISLITSESEAAGIGCPIGIGNTRVVYTIGYSGSVPRVPSTSRARLGNALSANAILADSEGVYVYNEETSGTTLASKSARNVAGNGSNRSPMISDDGQYVLFDSSSSNLVSNDTNKVWDVFRYNTLVDSIERVSVGSSGSQLTTFNGLNGIDYTGTKIAFTAAAARKGSNLDVTGVGVRADQYYADLNATGLYFRDTLAGTTTAVAAAGEMTEPSNSSEEYFFDEEGKLLYTRTYSVYSDESMDPLAMTPTSDCLLDSTCRQTFTPGAPLFKVKKSTLTATALAPAPTGGKIEFLLKRRGKKAKSLSVKGTKVSAAFKKVVKGRYQLYYRYRLSNRSVAATSSKVSLRVR